MFAHHVAQVTYEEMMQWRVIYETESFWVRLKSGKAIGTTILIDQFDTVFPLIEKTANQSPVRGLSKKELENAGVEFIPF
ncbi:MAG: hypothetical protein QM805_26790 [Pseudomonas sp.]